ncbi:MAG: M16 family metallopeptidase [Thermoanaerobaculia bacterium]
MAHRFDFASRLTERRLDNGLRAVLLPDCTRPLVTVNVWYHVGSKNERPGRTGFAHLFEHMLFQGSENVDTNDHFALIQQVGGVANGSTSFDRTNYYETLPSHCLELGLWLESDRMGFLLPALDGAKLANQKDVVMNERRQRVDNQPYGRAFETLHELLYPEGHPYSWPVIGYMDDIAATEVDEVHDFFRTHYRPGNSVLTLVGDFDVGEALELVETYFGDLPDGALPPPATAVDQPTSAKRHELHDDVSLPRLYLGFRGPRLTAPDFPAGDLYSLAVSGGKSSPLYRDLVLEREIAQDIYAGLLPLELESTVLVAMTLRPGVDPAPAERILLDRLSGWQAEPPADTDFERARNKASVGYLHEIESFESRADLLSQFATYHDDPALIDTELDRYARVEPADLRAFARRYLEPERCVTLWVLPREAA